MTVTEWEARALSAEADAAALRTAARSLTRSAARQVSGYDDMVVLVLRMALNDLNRVLDQKHPGAALLVELTVLRELAADVERWRESSDARDLAYILETADKYEAMKASNTDAVE